MVIRMSTLTSKVPVNRTRILVPASNGTLVLSKSMVAIQKTVENNNSASKDTLNDNQIVSNLTNAGILVSRKNRENGNGTEPVVCKAGGSSHDEELTSLSWLQNTNLLQSMNFSASASRKPFSAEKKNAKSDGLSKNVSLDESETESSWDGSNLSYSDTTFLPNQVMFPQTMEGEEEAKAPLLKPPHSFSTLIFLAIESSSSKALPVRDIYVWITKHFPYYCFAPVGWKNSVRHNLSLNKSFCKVEQGPNVGKGSLWMVDPLHRPQLLQSLCKVPYVKSEIIQRLMDETKMVQVKTEPIQENRKPVVLAAPSAITRPNMPDPKLFPYLSRRLAFNISQNEGPDVDAATAMLALGQSHTMFNPTQHSLMCPTSTTSHKKHLHANDPREEQDSVSGADDETTLTKTSKGSPAEDHTYSYSPRTGKLLTGSPVSSNTAKKPPLSSFPLETKLKRKLHDTGRYQDNLVLNEAEFDSEVEVKNLREERAAKVSRTVVRPKEKSRKRGRGRWR